MKTKKEIPIQYHGSIEVFGDEYYYSFHPEENGVILMNPETHEEREYPHDIHVREFVDNHPENNGINETNQFVREYIWECVRNDKICEDILRLYIESISTD